MSNDRHYGGVLRSILLAINACETAEINMQIEEPVCSRQARELLYRFKNELGSMYASPYETNEQLQAFDRVFTGCGWDNQGLRWTREDPDSPEDIFIVEFTDDKHEEWEIA